MLYVELNRPFNCAWLYTVQQRAICRMGTENIKQFIAALTSRNIVQHLLILNCESFGLHSLLHQLSLFHEELANQHLVRS